MATFTADLWSELGTQWSALRRNVGFADGLAVLPAWMAPAAALGALLALVVLSGVALAALGVLLTALLTAALLLEYAFGITIGVVAAR